MTTAFSSSSLSVLSMSSMSESDLDKGTRVPLECNEVLDIITRGRDVDLFSRFGELLREPVEREQGSEMFRQKGFFFLFEAFCGVRSRDFEAAASSLCLSLGLPLFLKDLRRLLDLDMAAWDLGGEVMELEDSDSSLSSGRTERRRRYLEGRARGFRRKC